MKSNLKIIKIVVAAAVMILASLPSVIGLTNISTKLENFNEQDVFEAVNIDKTTIQITVNPGEFEFGSINTKKGMFSTIKLPNFAFTFNKGEAKLPIIRRMIEIPYGSTPEITVTSISWEYISLDELNLPHRLLPAQQSIEKIPEQSEDFVISEEYYSINSFIPIDIVNIVQTGEFRGRRFALVEISPIQYKPKTGELKTMSSCIVTVDLPNSDMVKTYENIKRYSTSSYEKLFNNAFKNYGFYEQDLENKNSEGFLIIVYDNFYDEIQPLVTQKESKGYEVTTVKTSDIPGGATIEKITEYIEGAYYNWPTPPAYVLLVGDTPQIPTHTGISSFSEADLYYVTVDGTDFIPDIYIGRFPGSQKSHIEAMVDKTICYEQGEFSSYEWIKKAAFLASSDHGQLAEQTHNYVIDNYLNPYGYTSDKIYQANGGSTSDVFNSLNDGRSLCIYSGHGYSGGWACVPFDQDDVRNLANEGMYPFVCSHACSTNTFSDSECYGETWLREADKAAIAFWGASASTLWDEDDILEKGMFQAWWEDGLDWIGGMTDMGLLYLYENYSGGGYTRYYFEAYNLNGDPSIRIWIENPSEPPETPTQPDGPDIWVQYIETTFTSMTTDPEGENIYYLFDWGDGNNSGWIGPYASGQVGQTSHAWTELGEYEVKAISKDINGAQSDWSEPHIISIVENEPPENPTISGPKTGTARKTLKFTFVSTDPEGHDLYYMVNWGDDHYIPYQGPYASGEEVTFSHAWGEEGEYTIIAKSKDEFGAKSPQNSFTLTITKNKAVTYPVVLSQLLENLMRHFPLLERFLNLN